MTKKECFDAKWFDEGHNIKLNVQNQDDFLKIAKEVSDYIAGLHLSSEQNNELVGLLKKFTDTTELLAFVNGSLFAAGLAELAEENGGGQFQQIIPQ